MKLFKPESLKRFLLPAILSLVGFFSGICTMPQTLNNIPLGGNAIGKAFSLAEETIDNQFGHHAFSRGFYRILRTENSNIYVFSVKTHCADGINDVSVKVDLTGIIDRVVIDDNAKYHNLDSSL